MYIQQWNNLFLTKITHTLAHYERSGNTFILVKYTLTYNSLSVLRNGAVELEICSKFYLDLYSWNVFLLTLQLTSVHTRMGFICSHFAAKKGNEEVTSKSLVVLYMWECRYFLLLRLFVNIHKKYVQNSYKSANQFQEEKKMKRKICWLV